MDIFGPLCTKRASIRAQPARCKAGNGAPMPSASSHPCLPTAPHPVCPPSSAAPPRTLTASPEPRLAVPPGRSGSICTLITMLPALLLQAPCFPPGSCRDTRGCAQDPLPFSTSSCSGSLPLSVVSKLNLNQQRVRSQLRRSSHSDRHSTAPAVFWQS